MERRLNRIDEYIKLEETTELRILGIETSCDETAAAVVENGRIILGQTIASQIDIHTKFGGVVPEMASRVHVETITQVVEQTLVESGITWSDLDGIAVTCGPGLLGALLVGVSAAKGYALATGLPLIPVHHIAGHVAAALIDNAVDLPFLALVVSGGHTEILSVDEQFVFTRLGGTKDDAAGEAYDKVARMVGLAYPGGPKVDEMAAKGNPVAFSFPRSLIDEDNYDFSFSGLKTSVLNEINQRRQKGDEVPVADLCASFQQAVVEVLVEKAARAMKQTGSNQLVVAGGVAANQGLRKALQERAKQDSFKVHFPPLSLCTDNAAMIAAAGTKALERGLTHDLSLDAYATLSLADWQAGRFPRRA
ncbi:O-sialoglycoprotein endopeptidase [Alicyclobacillus ferrooxydans]|uniref:tRNA N6-adenosine threonylcarbamoyltransferase n=1 Tax=Alicyclobacillus ferrooxydans TaxID=471514 RepID=A0A0P9CZ32_9BACL|nr:O-sialoglycoprotein endopeptidase [Alicyclobacillus ferrooxydans]